MLPQELYDLIVDFCHDDGQTLRACSLASRALHTSSRPHIFRSILINSGRILERFHRLLETSKDVASLVEELHFSSYLNFMRKDPYLWICGATSFPHGLFKRLKVVEFAYVRFSELNVVAQGFMPTFYKNLSNYGGIGELRLSSCDFDHPDALKSFIRHVAPQSDQSSAFTLSLDCIDFGNPRGPPLATPSFANFRLTSFTMGTNARSDAIFSWLINTPSCRMLRAVNLKCVLGGQIIAVGDFLRDLGDALQDLQLGIRLDCAPGLVNEVQRIFDLSRNPRLRSLHLRILDHLSERYLINWVNALLMQATHLPLQKLTLEVWMHDPAQLRLPIWDDIEATLSSIPFRTVRDVLFIHKGDLDFVVARDALEKRFPALVSRRALTVRDCSTRCVIYGTW
ncbi:hypothetical protein C8Q72DRAFT_247330 [Fomitopsis betulina]|nr:hypothetical protein C8Q72DRAFT_247330 [Fomitopsis betulina]